MDSKGGKDMKAARIFAVALIALFGMMAFSGVVMAGDKVDVKGIIVDFDLDERTVTVDVGGEEMTFVVENDAALFKLDDRLFMDDEVKIKYVEVDGKKVVKESSDLKGTKPGC